MIEQIIIGVCGVVAIWLSQDARENVRRHACLVGMLSQPAWLFSAYTQNQWGMFFISCLYTGVWARGIYTNWIRKSKN